MITLGPYRPATRLSVPNCSRFLLLVFACAAVPGLDRQLAAQETPAADTPAEELPDAPAEKATLVVTKEVKTLLVPMLEAIQKAKVSRATVELTAESALSGKVVDSQSSTYQIASASPDKFTVYLKEAKQRTRIFCDGEAAIVALGSDAFFRLPEPINNQQATIAMPIPLGPYPEPVLALSMAGVDPSLSLFAGMKSVELVDRDPFRGETPALHFHGIQNDDVTWDLWVSSEGDQKPLRLLVDLTAMLKAADQVSVPEDFSYQLRIDFLSWRISGELDPALFQYTPAKDAQEFASLQEYYESMAGVAGEHPLLGKAMPAFEAETIDGKPVSSDDLAGKVVILDFWATWCQPCAAAIPIIREVASEFADQDVLLFAVNTGEERPLVRGFLEEQQWDLTVLLDPRGKVADTFQADAIPQTVVIGKEGNVESIHIGFEGSEALKQRLTDELEVLSVGGRIATSAGQPESAAGSTADDEASGAGASEESGSTGQR